MDISSLTGHCQRSTATLWRCHLSPPSQIFKNIWRAPSVLNIGGAGKAAEGIAYTYRPLKLIKRDDGIEVEMRCGENSFFMELRITSPSTERLTSLSTSRLNAEGQKYADAVSDFC